MPAPASSAACPGYAGSSAVDHVSPICACLAGEPWGRLSGAFSRSDDGLRVNSRCTQLINAGCHAICHRGGSRNRSNGAAIQSQSRLSHSRRISVRLHLDRSFLMFYP